MSDLHRVPSDFLASGGLDGAVRRLGVDLVGKSIGVYEITSRVGSGGMGDVYRARDTRLGRDVAIKVLPPEFTRDSERCARLEREARLLAALNHPHIAAIYGFEDAAGPPALILELVEGETLADRLSRGPLQVRDALSVATQIAEALEAAHEKGIVHRDLKPANIKLTDDGNVKVLDFGLAKLVRAPDGVSPMSGLTHEGTIAGTAAYMSPEQARGRQVDRRTDIWAFGCVLYEMLTSRPAFLDDTVSDTIAAVLDREPDWGALPGNTPESVHRLVRRCLEKNQTRRLQDIGDARIEIEDALAAPWPAGNIKHAGRDRVRWPAAAFIAGAIAAGSIAWVLRSPPAPALGAVRFMIEPPAMPNPFAFSISPDGQTIAFMARRPDGRSMVFVRPIGSVHTRPLPGTEDAIGAPFWSPDNRYLAFATISTPRQLKKVALSGGRPQIVCDLLRANPFMGTWSSGGVIVFVDGDWSLYRVSASGGTPALVARPDKRAGEVGHSFPHFLPDGTHYLHLTTSANRSRRAVMIRSLDSGIVTELMQSESLVTYAPPHFLMFTRQRTLVTQRFNASTLKLEGQPVAVADEVLYRADMGRAAFAVSHSGALLYRTGGTDTGQRSLVWMERNGGRSGPIGDPIDTSNIRLSPDATRVAFGHRKAGEGEDIWVHDLQRGPRFPVTNHPAIDHTPVWSPDGLQIGFDSHRGTDDAVGLYGTRADGAGAERELLSPEPGINAILDWTSDYILYSKRTREDMSELWARRLSGDSKPFLYLPGVTNAALSPDERWVALVANVGGTNEIIVQSFPDRSKSRQKISLNGGTLPRWRRDGRELFYLDPDWRVMAVPVQPDGTVVIEKSTNLFTAPGYAPPPGSVGYTYDITPDGQRFLFSIASGGLEPTAPITVVLDWPADLNKQK